MALLSTGVEAIVAAVGKTADSAAGASAAAVSVAAAAGPPPAAADPRGRLHVMVSKRLGLTNGSFTG